MEEAIVSNSDYPCINYQQVDLSKGCNVNCIYCGLANNASTIERLSINNLMNSTIIPEGLYFSPNSDPFSKINIDNTHALLEKYLPLGGILSGFFGGLSGHQGALRSLFLLRCGLSKESFIATGVIVACLVDISRLVIYSSRFAEVFKGGNISLLVVAVLSAFLGVFVGKRFLKKVTMRGIQLLVSIMLIFIALGLSSGAI